MLHLHSLELLHVCMHRCLAECFAIVHRVQSVNHYHPYSPRKKNQTLHGNIHSARKGQQSSTHRKKNLRLMNSFSFPHAVHPAYHSRRSNPLHHCTTPLHIANRPAARSPGLRVTISSSRHCLTCTSQWSRNHSHRQSQKTNPVTTNSWTSFAH